MPRTNTLPLTWLDTLWLQVTGTVCNIACRHCFISCGPKSTAHAMLGLDDARAVLREAEERGVRGIWFTGGEPFLHPDILELIDAALEVGPLGILTNGMLIDEDMAAELGQRFRDAPYSLEIRVSLDGCTAEQNDRIRGRGVFRKTTEAIARLERAGVPALVAVALVEEDAPVQRQALLDLLESLEVRRPRIKWIPPFRIGREANRGRAYATWERIPEEALSDPETPHRLQCGTSRTVTAEGVWPCPILINEPDFRLGDDLGASLGPHRVDHEACYTCYVEGFSCSA